MLIASRDNSAVLTITRPIVAFLKHNFMTLINFRGPAATLETLSKSCLRLFLLNKLLLLRSPFKPDSGGSLLLASEPVISIRLCLVNLLKPREVLSSSSYLVSVTRKAIQALVL